MTAAAEKENRSRPGAMTRAAFLARFGPVYEHFPWVAERVHDAGLRPEHDVAAGLHQAMRRIIDEAGEATQLELLCAHPDLAGKLATRGELTADSISEQSGAGLDQCTPEEFEAFRTLNERYRKKFGFPFILAVRGLDRPAILAAFRRRVDNDHKSEFAEALNQVHRIAALRIETLI